MTKITSVLYLSVFALIGALCVSSVSVQAQALSASVPSSNNACVKIVKQIRKGHRGADVLSLQQFLIAKGLLSADSNTGYFGNLTAAAVVKFQAQNGLETVGSVGPRTLGLINAACAGGNPLGNSVNHTDGNMADANTNMYLIRGMQLGGVTVDKLKQPPVCVTGSLLGDLNNDNNVDMWDLVVLARNYDLPAGQLMDPMADKNGNNDVEFFEALKVAQDFGKTTNCNPNNNVPQTTDTNTLMLQGAQLAGINADRLDDPITCTTQNITLGDLNNDGKVDGWDLVIAARNYGKPSILPGDAAADKNGDGKVDFFELLKVAQLFGLKSCQQTTAITLNYVQGIPTSGNQTDPQNVLRAGNSARVYGVFNPNVNNYKVYFVRSGQEVIVNVTQDFANVLSMVVPSASQLPAGQYSMFVKYAQGTSNTIQVSVEGQSVPPPPTNSGNTTCVSSAAELRALGDLNSDGVIDIADYNIIRVYYGQTSGVTMAQGDLDGNGAVGNMDLFIMYQNFGRRVCTVPAQPSADQQQAMGYAVQFNISQDGLFNDPTTCTTNNINMGDLDSNGKVNWWDLVLLGRNYNKPAGQLVDPTADKNGDGVVNFSELLGVSQNWMKVSCPADNNSSNSSSAQSSS